MDSRSDSNWYSSEVTISGIWYSARTPPVLRQMLMSKSILEELYLALSNSEYYSTLASEHYSYDVGTMSASKRSISSQLERPSGRPSATVAFRDEYRNLASTCMCSSTMTRANMDSDGISVDDNSFHLTFSQFVPP